MRCAPQLPSGFPNGATDASSTAERWLACNDPKYATIGLVAAIRIERNRELRARRSCASVTVDRDKQSRNEHVWRIRTPSEDLATVLAGDPHLCTCIARLAEKRQGTKRVASYILDTSPLSVGQLAGLAGVSRRQIYYDKRRFQTLLQAFADARLKEGSIFKLSGQPDPPGVSPCSVPKHPRAPRSTPPIPGQFNFLHLLRAATQ